MGRIGAFLNPARFWLWIGPNSYLGQGDYGRGVVSFVVSVSSFMSGVLWKHMVIVSCSMCIPVPF